MVCKYGKGWGVILFATYPLNMTRCAGRPYGHLRGLTTHFTCWSCFVRELLHSPFRCQIQGGLFCVLCARHLLVEAWLRVVFFFFFFFSFLSFLSPTKHLLHHIYPLHRLCNRSAKQDISQFKKLNEIIIVVSVYLVWSLILIILLRQKDIVICMHIIFMK